MTDFSGQNTLALTRVEDENLGMVELTVKDGLGGLIGTFTIETVRARAFFEALATLERQYSLDLDETLQGAKTTIKRNAGTAVVEFG